MTEYTPNPTQTGISLAYTNNSFIADKIFKKVPVETRSFKYFKYAKDLNLQLPNDVVGDKGDPEKIDFKGERMTATVVGHSLVDEIPQTQIDDAKGDKENLQTTSTEFLTKVFMACEEKRIADMLQTSANYGTNNKTLTAQEKFTVATSNAFEIIDNATQEIWQKPNLMVGSRKAINALRRNPYVVKAAHCNSGDAGKATLEDLKDMFELQDVLVGESIVNTAKKGQIASYAGVWGNAIMLLYIDPQATVKHGLTFGFTAEFGKREMSEIFEPRRGVRGVLTNKIAEETTSLIVAPECGYLISNIY